MKTCKRCGAHFPPETRTFSNGKTIEHNCCQDCRFRNILDGLDLPTPPELLDPFSKHPALTGDEHKKMLKEVKKELE